MRRPEYYVAYGLRIRSEVPLPHFGVAAPDQTDETDVTVRLGAVPSNLSGPGLIARRNWEMAPGDFLLRVEDTLRLRVIGGREIVVQRPEGADSLAAVHLMGTGFTALLHQRGLLALHASAVVCEQGAVLFLGQSGAGKSTLAAALVARGFKFLADDVTVVRAASAGPPRATPGYPNLRLWADALGRLGLTAENLRLARDGIDKYLLPAGGAPDRLQPVRAAYALAAREAETLELQRLRPAKAFEILNRNIHRRRLVNAMGGWEANFRALGHFALSVPVTRVNRPTAGISPNALGERIERHLADGSV